MKSKRAKVLHELGGRPLIACALDAVTGAGIDRMVAVVGHDREQVSQAISDYNPEIRLAVQEQQSGTGHAVGIALAELDDQAEHQEPGTVIVTYGDVPLLEPATIRAVIESHDAAGRYVTVLTAELPDPTGYGRILRDDNGAVRAIREHRDATEAERQVREVNSGILVVEAGFLKRAIPRLQPHNEQGELYLTDIVAQAVEEGLPVGAHVLEDVWQTEGVNDRAQLARLARELNHRITAHWMAEGVTIIDPETTWIDSAVTLEPDVTIHPNTQLLGATTIGAGATIGPDTTLRNTEVGADAAVIRTHGSDAVIGAGASVGPFSYLRAGTEIGSHSKVGAYVETKNTQIGDHAKIPHLSYIGDSTIGEGTNIGAGTITANYDGVSKYKTTIGRHCRTGSNNVFVAPVEIADGVFTGAGTTVRRDVPAGALTVNHVTQRIIEGWVAANRPDSKSARAARQSEGQETTGD